VRAFDAILVALEPGGRNLRGAVAALDTVTSTMHIGYFAMVAQLLGGWRDVCAGDLRGVATLRDATDRMRPEQPLHLTLGLSLLARAHHAGGDPAAGRGAVAEAVAMTARSGQRYLLPELLRVDAELLALSGDATGAAATARRAVETAVAVESPWLRDRALATLSALPPGA
jgi:hypothetical protein